MNEPIRKPIVNAIKTHNQNSSPVFPNISAIILVSLKEYEVPAINGIAMAKLIPTTKFGFLISPLTNCLAINGISLGRKRYMDMQKPVTEPNTTCPKMKPNKKIANIKVPLNLSHFLRRSY